MSTTFHRHWTPEGEYITVDHFEDHDFITPEILGVGCASGIETRITITVANGSATYVVVGWDRDRRALEIQKVVGVSHPTQVTDAAMALLEDTVDG